jgi:hypothetical protein
VAFTVAFVPAPAPAWYRGTLPCSTTPATTSTSTSPTPRLTASHQLTHTSAPAAREEVLWTWPRSERKGCTNRKGSWAGACLGADGR